MNLAVRWVRKATLLASAVLAAACAGDFPPGQRPDIGQSWEPLAPQRDLYPARDQSSGTQDVGGDGPVIARDTRTPTGCKADEQAFSGHCYRRASGLPMTYAEARTNCSSSGGKVAVLETKAEDDFVYGLLSSTTKGCWIGLSRSNGTWGWEGGAALSYANWAPGEPNNESGFEDCAVLWGPGLVYPEMRAKWNDVPCHDPGRDTAVCERAP